MRCSSVLFSSCDSVSSFEIWWNINEFLNHSLSGLHLHLLVFPFVYQFNSRIGVLFHSSFALTDSEGFLISTTFQHHFKMCLLWFLHEKECSFYTHLFCCTEIRWLFISSTAIWVTGSDTGSVACRARSKLTSSKCEWTRIWTI